jgi:flagellar protein FliS
MYNYDALNEYQQKAGGAIQRNDIAERGRTISESIRIIDNLRASLDFENGGTISTSLASLYDYMERRLVEANAQSNVQILEEVVTLINSTISIQLSLFNYVGTEYV